MKPLDDRIVIRYCFVCKECSEGESLPVMFIHINDWFKHKEENPTHTTKSPKYAQITIKFGYIHKINL